LNAELRAGSYDGYRELTPFLERLRQDIRQVTPDRHLGVWPIWFAPTPPDSSEAGLRDWRKKQSQDNYGFRRVEILSGNVGYIELTRFVDPEVAGPAAKEAMESLEGVDALIVDVRANHGGSEHMVNLVCGYLFAEPVHTISFYTRYRDESIDLWTPEDVSGSPLAAVPVYVLQSGESASAAEHLCYALQAAGRATVVGERSRGASNPVEERVYPELSINISLPVSRATHPVTGTNWEGVGVEPDVEVAAEKALDTAHGLALRRLQRASSSGQKTGKK
jgi:C-terminal processing protease CtpA/Prc